MRYRRRRQGGWGRAWCWLAVAGLLQCFPGFALGNPTRPPPPKEPKARGFKKLKAQVLYEHGLQLYKRGRYEAAIAALSVSQKLRPGDRWVRFYLARAYMQRGNVLALRGQIERQRRLYKQALDLDPRLLEDAGFLKRYRYLQAHASQSLRARSGERPYKARAFGFGLGLTLGIEGLFGIQVGALVAGMVNPLLTFSPVLQSIDLTLRIIPLRGWSWSPYVAAGVALPIPLDGQNALAGQRAPIVHGTVGVHYVSSLGLTFVAGLSFTYDFTPQLDAPFLPIPSVQLAWYF